MKHFVKASMNASNVLHALSQNGFTRVDSRVSTRSPFWYKDFYNDEYGYFEVRVWEPGYAVEIIAYEDSSSRAYQGHEVGRLSGVPTIIREESAFDDINKVISKVKTLSTLDYYHTKATMMSARTRKRPIKASTISMKSDFQKFAKELESDIIDNEPALDEFELDCTYVADRDAVALCYITPIYQGVIADSIDTLTIQYNKYDYNNSGYTFVAYCSGNGDIVAKGKSFSDIRFNCYNWLKETMIALYEEHDFD